MPPPSSIAMPGAALILLCTAGTLARAENDRMLMHDPSLQRGRVFFLPFMPIRPQYYEMRPRPYVAPIRPIRPIRPRRPPPAPLREQTPAVVREEPAAPKVNVRYHVAVLGDSLGELVANGLDEITKERPDLAVLRKTKLETGLVRADFYDWPKAVNTLLDGSKDITAAVMLLGLNDRQPIRDGDAMAEPMSERWQELYRARIDAIATAFASKKIPLIWVGLPPAQSTRLSADYATLNDLFRQRVEQAGGRYVDLWAGYVDAENRYSATGPDISGQMVRLRTADGVHFTRAGARKAAHFIDVALRRLIDERPENANARLPGGPALDHGDPQAGKGEATVAPAVYGPPMPDRRHLPRPERPLVGPVQPLTGVGAAGEKRLFNSMPEARGYGAATQWPDAGGSPKPGRIDDHRWPRSD